MRRTRSLASPSAVRAVLLAGSVLVSGLASALLPGIVPAARAATPPAQPKDGPGGIGEAGASITKRAVGRAGAATFAYYAGGAPPAAGRPVVVFLHAWGAANPQVYGAWIDHLARQGNLVLFPRFQEVNRTRPADATANAGNLVKEALAALANDPEAKPDAGRVAFVGHLAGAPIAANLAAEARRFDLPVPRLVFAAMPGGIARDAAARGIALTDLGAISPATLIVTEVGDREFRAAEIAARRILKEATAVPPERKIFVRALSDDHGFPALSATLASPAAVSAAYDGAAIKLPPDPPRDPKQRAAAPAWRWSADMALTGEQATLVAQINNAGTDSLDYLAYWKTLDMAMGAAFAGRDAVALRNDPRFTDMERWSDGWPVKRLATEMPKTSAEATATAVRAKPAPSKMVVPRGAQR